MNNYKPLLHLGSSTPRRAGLSRGGYRGPPLLQSLKASPQPPPPTMPARNSKRASTIAKEEPVKRIEIVEEDVLRPPDDSDDDDMQSVDIKRTEFVPGSSRQPVPTSKSPKKTKPDSNGAVKVNNASTTRSSRGRKADLATPSSSNASATSTTSAKRKTEEDTPVLGASMVDELGFIKRSAPKKARQSYGSRSSQPGKVKVLVTKRKNQVFKTVPDLDGSPELLTPNRSFRSLPSIGTTPTSTSKSVNKFRGAEHNITPTVPEEKMPGFKTHDLGDIADSDEDTESNLLSSLPSGGVRQAAEAPPATQQAAFISRDLGIDEDILSTARAIVDEMGVDNAAMDMSMQDDDDFLTMTQRAICPLCGEPVSPEQLRAYGRMNVRTQEKFCRKHQSATAREEWENNGYPIIDWDNLDSRISKHHTFIRKLIKGQDSHYRTILSDKVAAGQDRNIRKSNTDLTPGYYGARGLRKMSENIMDKFTPLLKKRMVKDPLMSARGVTAYVQSVLVPELASLLISEDMRVEVEEGREILSSTVKLGELLNEEERDVVRKRVVDSEEESD